MNTLRVLPFVLPLLAAGPAQASFHLMQIEQAIGGVGGDVTQQAVQLRMRSAFQNQMQFSRLRVLDAAGANPVTLIDFATPVANSLLGDRILVASPAFAAAQGPVPDFLMAATIPPAYFAGGQLSFESDGGQVVYSLCWGSYAGASLGSLDNDADGQYAPCEAGPLPSGSLSALRFDGAASALGSSNAADFSLTAGAATFTNNARAAATLVAPPQVARGGDCNDNDALVSPGLPEIAGNLRDDDCDGLADESLANVPSGDGSDADGDGQAIADGDCDDTTTAVRRGIDEVFGDLRDNDCDGLADEDANDVPSSDGVDHDGDGFGLFPRVFASGFEG